MTSFALVHGAGHGAWCWDRVVPQLIAAGHHAIAVELPASDPHAGPDRYADVVAAAIARERDVVVVGHSLGGLTIPLVAARRPVRRLVFVAGLLPRPRERPFRDDPDAPPESAAGLRVDTRADGSYTFPPEIARAYLYNRCSEADAVWAIERLRPQSRRPIDETCPLAALPKVPMTYIACRDDRVVTLEHATYLARTRLGIDPVILDADHSPFLSAPGALVNVLLATLEHR